MKITPTSASYLSGRLWVGVTIEGPQGAWIRFARLRLRPGDVPVADLAMFLKAALDASMEDRDEEDEPLF